MCGHNPFRVQTGGAVTGLSLRSNPGLKLANAFGVIWLKFFKRMHDCELLCSRDSDQLSDGS